MAAAISRAMDIAAHWPGNRKPGPVMIPPFAEKHGTVKATNRATQRLSVEVVSP